MSNYNCPSCWNVILDTPGWPNEKHICTKYIPYSKRNWITDPDLAWLLDYLERVQGWELRHDIVEDINQWHIFQENGDQFSIHDNGWVIHIICNQSWPYWGYRPAFREMIPEVFFRSYKTLLPVIRDLYSK